MDMFLYHFNCDFGRCRYWSGGVLFAASERFMNDVLGSGIDTFWTISQRVFFLFVVVYPNVKREFS